MALITVLIPAFNEAQNIKNTIMAIKEAINSPKQIIVIDDGSTDGTYEIAKDLAVEVHRLAQNTGKGGALNFAIPMVQGDYVLLLDGDLGYSAKEAKKLLDKVRHGQADVAIAKFPASKKTGFGLVKKLAKYGIYLCTGKTLDCVLSGQRAMTKEVFEKITPFTEGYSIEVASTIKLLRLGFKIIEVPTNMTHEITGRDFHGFYHRGKQFWHIFKYLVYEELI